MLGLILRVVNLVCLSLCWGAVQELDKYLGDAKAAGLGITLWKTLRDLAFLKIKKAYRKNTSC